MKKFFILFIIPFLITFSSVNAQTNTDIIITSSDLEYLAVTRLSDIFSILPQLDVYTIDGYRHSSLQGNLFVNAPNDIILLINGVKTNFGMWNKVNISQFPVHLSSIDSIIVIHSPTSYNGEFSSGILIDIITKTPSEGISLTGTYSTGNETGDPGPYRYTEYSSENVDQLGPYTLFKMNYGSNKFDLSFSLIHQISPSTDPAILRRSNYYNFYNYQVQHIGGSLNISTLSQFGKHTLFSSYSKTGNAVIGSVYGADLFFVDELSCEFPYESESIIISSGNEIVVGEDKKLLVDFNLSHTSADQSKLFDEFQFNSEDIWLYSKIAYESSIRGLNYLIGSSFSYQNIKNRLTDFNYSRNFPSFFTSVNFKSLENLSHYIDANYRCEDNSNGLFVKLENKIELNRQNRLSLTLSSGNLFNIQNSLDYRISKGYTFLNNVGYQTYNYDSNAIQNSLSVNYSYLPDEITSLNAGLNITDYTKLDYLLNDFIYNADNRIIQNIQTDVFSSVKGTEGELYFSLSNRLFKNLEQKFYYRYKSSLTGDEIFEQAMKRFPAHKIFYSIYYKAFKDLFTSLTINYLSSAEWIEYRNIESPEDDHYLQKLSGRFLINCAVTKEFWNERIKFSAMIYNLLNSRIQYNPVGGTFDLTFYLKVEASLESLFVP